MRLSESARASPYPFVFRSTRGTQPHRGRHAPCAGSDCPEQLVYSEERHVATSIGALRQINGGLGGWFGATAGILGSRGASAARQRIVRRLNIDGDGQGDLIRRFDIEDREIRTALDRHWAASDANDFEAEHQIYRE